ncbi:hypothetical protein GCM10009676_02110 [Prauserella halophila]|uniref:Uncharacterized protein n=1 Tax=Prauserella halophila TaxID=185641 RepID=A0ABP4GFZ9_9PSEU|nr:hypothetical protein [Prauserella halophila]MCP2234449.1 hypothetical protein [Prauserella halophila]
MAIRRPAAGRGTTGLRMPGAGIGDDVSVGRDRANRVVCEAVQGRGRSRQHAVRARDPPAVTGGGLVVEDSEEVRMRTCARRSFGSAGPVGHV